MSFAVFCVAEMKGSVFFRTSLLPCVSTKRKRLDMGKRIFFLERSPVVGHIFYNVLSSSHLSYFISFILSLYLITSLLLYRFILSNLVYLISLFLISPLLSYLISFILYRLLSTNLSFLLDLVIVQGAF